MKIFFALPSIGAVVASLLLVSSAYGQEVVTPQAHSKPDTVAVPKQFWRATTAREVAVYLSPAQAKTPLYLDAGTEVLVTQSLVSRGMHWAKITGEKRDYFVNEAALSFYSLDTSPALARNFIQAARRFLGVPYVFGGASMGGTDAGGLVQNAAKRAGCPFPRVSREQWKIGFPVDIKDLQPGDRLYFSASGVRIDHSGIYTGNGRILEANGGVGRVIERNLFKTSMFKRTYVGARRGLMKKDPPLSTRRNNDGGEVFSTPSVRQDLAQPLTKTASR